MTTAKTYRVTVKLEDHHPVARDAWRLAEQPHWGPARDENGVWVTYAAKHFASTPQQAVAAMFHACEVASVDGNTALIYGG